MSRKVTLKNGMSLDWEKMKEKYVNENLMIFKYGKVYRNPNSPTYSQLDAGSFLIWPDNSCYPLEFLKEVIDETLKRLKEEFTDFDFKLEEPLPEKEFDPKDIIYSSCYTPAIRYNS